LASKIASKFSLLMSIYEKENPNFFNSCMNSVIKQTYPPSEIVLVKDGPLNNELENIISKWKKRFGNKFKIIPLEKNVGLGKALQLGLLNSKYDIVARMDTDDICREDRFEKQINFLDNNPNIDIVGCWAAEFENNINNIISIRKVPILDIEIKKYARFRNPFNHPSVVFRKHAILTCGGYQSFPFLEDYYLWIRMLLKGKKFANLPEPLLLFRLDKYTFDRRGGLKYFFNEIKLQKFFLKVNFINLPIFIYNIFLRGIVRLFPNKIRKYFYMFFLR